MALANRFAKYIVQPEQDQGGGSAPAKKPNRFAKYKQAETAPPIEGEYSVKPAAPAQSNGGGMGPVNPMVAMGLNAQRQALIGEAERYRQGKVDQVNAQRRPFQEEPVDVQQVIADMDKAAADRSRREAYEQEGIRQNKESLFGSLGIPTGFDPKAYANTRMAGDAVVQDVSKLGKTAPLNVWNGGVEAAQSAINLLPDVAQSLLDVGGETKTQNRVPTADFQRARMEISPEDQSVSGSLLENLVQFIAARKAVGSAAPGGGVLPQIGKDALAIGVGFDGSTGRVADMIDPSIVPEGPLRDYAQFLRTQPEDSALVGRFKNLLEDLTVSGPMAVPQAVVAPVARAVGNAINPPTVPTNAGGARPGPINTAAVMQPPARQAPPPIQPAAQATPSLTPPPVAQPPGRGAQAGATGAGQQAPGGAQPVLNATQVPANPAVAKDTQDILRKLLIDSNVPRNDVDRLLGELTNDFQVFKGSGSPVASRVGLGEFVDSNVRQTANRIGVSMTPDVERQIQNALRGRGRAAHGSEGGSKQDRQPSVMSQYIEDLRTTQKDWAREQIEAPNAFNKADISVQKQAMEATADDIGQQVYGEGLKLAKDVWSKAATAAPGEIEALTKLQTYLNRKPYLDNIPASMKLRLAIDDIPLETRIADDPAGTAHWIQSKLGKAASEAADPDMRSALGEARERLLRELEAAVPAYKQARADFGDEYATMRAFDFGRPFFAETRRPLDVSEMKSDYGKMTTRQKTAARMAVRDEIFGVFGMNAEDAAVRLEVLTRENTLNALEEVFGAPGKRVADTLRRLRQESNWMAGDRSRGLPGVDIYSGSNTVANAQILNRDAASVRNGFQRAIAKAGDVSKFMFAVPADLALMVGSGGAYHLPMLSLGAAGGKITKGLANANPRKLSNATEGLFSLQKQAPKPLAPRGGGNRLRAPAAPKAPLPTDRRELLEAYAAAPTKRERERIRRALEAMGENVPAIPAKTPPAPKDAGSAGMTPLAALIGGSGGAMLAPDVNGDGVDAGERIATAILGATGAGYGASRLAPKTRGAPLKSGPLKPPAMAEAGTKAARSAAMEARSADRLSTLMSRSSISFAEKGEVAMLMRARGMSDAEIFEAIQSRSDAAVRFKGRASPEQVRAIVDGLVAKGQRAIAEDEGGLGVLAAELTDRGDDPVRLLAGPNGPSASEVRNAEARWRAHNAGKANYEPDDIKQAIENKLKPAPAGRQRPMGGTSLDVNGVLNRELRNRARIAPPQAPPASPTVKSAAVPKQQEFDPDPWYHAGSLGDEMSADAGELGLHIGNEEAAKFVQGRGVTRKVKPQISELRVRGNFAQTPDLGNFGSPYAYLRKRADNASEIYAYAKFDPRYKAMWEELDAAAQSLPKISDPNSPELPKVLKQWRDKVHDAAKRNDISGWEYTNYAEGGGDPSRVVFDPSAVRKSAPPSPTGKPSGAPKPPPAQAGFGGGKGPKAPPTGKSRIPGEIGRRLATGAATWTALTAANAADAQEDLSPKIGFAEQQISDLGQKLADFEKIKDPRAKQQFLKDAGYYAGKIDGNIAGKTTEGMERWTAKVEADMAKYEADLVDLRRRDALQRNEPNPYVTALRDVGPNVAAIAVILGMKPFRASAAKKSVATAEKVAKGFDRYVTKGPVTSYVNKADQSRPANLNTFWKAGGAKVDELPFLQDSKGGWKPNPKAKSADELFSDNGYWKAITRYVSGKDLAFILGGTVDAVGAQFMIDSSNEKLRRAEALWNEKPSDETARLVEDARNEVAMYTLVQRLGAGVAAGRALGSFGNAYARPRPKLEAAAKEQAAIKEYIAGKKPPPRPRAPKVLPPTQLPPIGGAPNGGNP